MHAQSCMPAPIISRINTSLTCAGHQLQKGDTAAGQEADNWQQNASSWCAALMQQHPLYRDLVQPVALAVYEVRCGLSLLKHAASARPEQLLADAVLADCMALPSRLGQGAIGALIASKNIHVPLLILYNIIAPSMWYTLLCHLMAFCTAFSCVLALLCCLMVKLRSSCCHVCQHGIILVHCLRLSGCESLSDTCGCCRCVVWLRSCSAAALSAG